MVKKLRAKILDWKLILQEQFNFFSLNISATKLIVLHLLHAPLDSGTSGTEGVTKKIIELVDTFDHVVVAVLDGETKVYFRNQIFTIRNYVKKDQFKLRNTALEIHLKKLINKIKPKIIDIQNLHGYPINILKLGKSYPLFTHLHDFGIFYPTPERFDFEGFDIDSFLNNPKNIDSAYYNKRKSKLTKLLSNISALISVSEFVTKVIKTTFLKEIPIYTIENAVEKTTIPEKTTSKKLRVAFLGLFAIHKGARMFIDLAKKDTRNEFNWTILGQISQEIKQDEIPVQVFQHGKYKTQDLPQLLANVDIVVIPGLVSETYSLALSEAITNKCFPLVTEIGALGLRLKNFKIGATYPPENFVEESWKILKLFNKHRELFKQEVIKIEETRLPTEEEFKYHYEKLYSSVIN